jgi:hypothetical protein
MPERQDWQRIEAIFHGALERVPAFRRFEGDGELRRQVELAC